MEQMALCHGHQTALRPSGSSGGVRGVGTNPSPTSMVAQVPIAVPGLGQGTYTGPVLDNSDVPALLGLRTMEKRHAILDLRTNKRHLYFAENADDLEIKIRPNAKGALRLQLEQAPSGHLLLPCSEFGLAKAQHHVAFNIA